MMLSLNHYNKQCIYDGRISMQGTKMLLYWRSELLTSYFTLVKYEHVHVQKWETYVKGHSIAGSNF